MEDDDKNNWDGLQIFRVSTDDGDRKATLFRFQSNDLVIDNDDFVDQIPRTKKRLQDLIGTVISPPEYNKIIARCKSAVMDDSVVGVTRPGFERAEDGSPRYFALPNGLVVTRHNLPLRLIPMFEKNSAASHKGNLDTYVRELGPLIKDQPIAMVIFFFALTPILQPLIRGGPMNVENVMIELVGATSTYKSTLTNQLAGSVWGGSETKLGYASSWNATPNAVEQMCRNYNNCLLVLDEATAAGATSKSRADNILNTSHRISLGRSKARLGGEDPVPYDLMALSNSNQPLTDILASSGTVSGALEVRLLTFDCAHPKHGYLRPIKGVGGVEVHIGPQLRDLCTTHYGHVAPSFIYFVLAECARDAQGFRQKVAFYMQRFLTHFRITARDERALRQAKPFALTYACAKLANDFLITDHTWGKTGSAILKAYRGFINQRQPLNRYEEIRHFLYDRTKTIVDCRVNPKAKMTLAEFEAVDGFVVEVKGQQVLAISPTALERNFSDVAGLKRYLASSNRLIKTEGYLFKKGVRLGADGTVIKDRFYMVKVRKWPKRFR